MSGDTSAQVHEYSYFRAGAVVSDAIAVVIAARSEVEALRLELCQRFGAYNMFFDQKNGQCDILCFAYHKDTDVPDGWTFAKRGQGTHRAIPAGGTADHFTLLGYQGRLTRALRRTELATFLDIPAMPVKPLPAGSYSQRFVRKETFVSHYHPYVGFRPEPDDHGIYKEIGSPMGSAANPSGYQQNVTFLQYGGVYYVRVPNNDAGQPLWTPPDSTPVSYDEMLAIDTAQYSKQHGNTSRPRFGV